MEPPIANSPFSLRQVTQRLGLGEFWRWWTAELVELVPMRWRNALGRARLRPIVVFTAEEAVIWTVSTGEGRLAYQQAARIPLQGDAAQAARAAIEPLRKSARRSGVAELVLALTPQQVLKKRLTYPAAVEPELERVLGYDLDRHTPFKTDEVYYAAAITGRDTTRGEIRVELASALKSLVDRLRRQVEAWGAQVVAIVPDAPVASTAPGGVLRLNLLPEEDRPRQRHRGWLIAAPAALVVAAMAAALALPIVDKRERAIALRQQTDQARAQAASADALRGQLEAVVENYNFTLSRKYAYPSVLQVLDDVTRLLPDDTWLTSLELKTLAKTKELPRKEIVLRGESGNAGRLVSLLEDSHLFEQAAPRSPTTKIQPGPGEIFDLGAQLKPTPMPEPVAIGLAKGDVVGAPGGVRGGSAAPGNAPMAGATGSAAAANSSGAASSGPATANGSASAPAPSAANAAAPTPARTAGSPPGKPATAAAPAAGTPPVNGAAVAPPAAAATRTAATSTNRLMVVPGAAGPEEPDQ